MRKLALCCLASLCWLLVECALTVRSARRATNDLVVLADWHAAEIERRADERIGDALGMLERRLSSIEQRADARIAEAVRIADRRIADAAGSADARVADAIDEARRVAAETRAAVSEAKLLIEDVRRSYATVSQRLDYWTDCEQNGLCWQGAATDTMLAVRRAALSVDRAMPQIVASAQASAQGVQATAQASAQTAENLARLTQPGPRWLRYLGVGLSVAAPASQIALPFVIKKAELR